MGDDKATDIFCEMGDWGVGKAVANLVKARGVFLAPQDKEPLIVLVQASMHVWLCPVVGNLMMAKSVMTVLSATWHHSVMPVQVKNNQNLHLTGLVCHENSGEVGSYSQLSD